MKLSNLIPFSLSLLAAASASAQFWSVGSPPGEFPTSSVTGLSSDGSVAAGRAMGDWVGGAFRWTADSGRYSIGQESGVPNGTWAHGISGDGRVLIGSGIATGQLEEAYRWSGPGTYQGLGNMGTFMASSTYGYVVTIPTPSTLAPAVCGVLALSRRRRVARPISS